MVKKYPSRPRITQETKDKLREMKEYAEYEIEKGNEEDFSDMTNGGHGVTFDRVIDVALDLLREEKGLE